MKRSPAAGASPPSAPPVNVVTPPSGVRFAIRTPSLTRYEEDPPSASSVPKYAPSFVNDTSTKASGPSSGCTIDVPFVRSQIWIDTFRSVPWIVAPTCVPSSESAACVKMPGSTTSGDEGSGASLARSQSCTPAPFMTMRVEPSRERSASVMIPPVTGMVKTRGCASVAASHTATPPDTSTDTTRSPDSSRTSAAIDAVCGDFGGFGAVAGAASDVDGNFQNVSDPSRRPASAYPCSGTATSSNAHGPLSGARNRCAAGSVCCAAWMRACSAWLVCA